MQKKVLNVGGNNKAIALPKLYDNWEHLLLDIDPKSEADIVCDARELTTFEAATFDSVYCSHNLEHYYRHEVPQVLAGFWHVLKDRGFVFIRVPDIGALMQRVVHEELDINDVLYESPAGPITVNDVLYGHGKEIEESQEDFYAHKTGFTQKSLEAALTQIGFTQLKIVPNSLEIVAVGFKGIPEEES